MEGEREMKRDEIKVGSFYEAKVSKRWSVVEILAAPLSGGWIGRNMRTGSKVRIRGSQRLRKELTPKQFNEWYNQEIKQGIKDEFDLWRDIHAGR